MKYIRTEKDIYEIDKDISYNGNEIYKVRNHNFSRFSIIGNGLRKADTIEELIQDGDILYIHDLYPDVVLVVEGSIKPFGYNNPIKLKEWLKNKFTEFDLYIKQQNGDYHKIAEKKQSGEIKLI